MKIISLFMNMAVVLIMACLPSGAVSLIDSPRGSGAVNDFAGVITPQTRIEMERAATALFDRLGFALVIVTTKDLGGEAVEDVATRLYEKWGIGVKGKDEGALVLLSVDDRMIRIEVGYGSEGYLTDAMSGGIIRGATPYLARGMWDEGLVRITGAVARAAADAKSISVDDALTAIPRMEYQPTSRTMRKPGIGTIILTALVILFLVGTPMGRSMLPWILMMMVSSGRSGRSSGGFGGGGGGGFGGFGGGMSGGGGATGRF